MKMYIGEDLTFAESKVLREVEILKILESYINIFTKCYNFEQ